jgi:hypothetical protein
MMQLRRPLHLVKLNLCYAATKKTSTPGCHIIDTIVQVRHILSREVELTALFYIAHDSCSLINKLGIPQPPPVIQKPKNVPKELLIEWRAFGLPSSSALLVTTNSLKVS